MDPIIPPETLSQALSRVWQNDWQHRRSGATLRSQAEKALITLGPDTLVSKVDISRIRALTQQAYIIGLSPATIQKRLNCLRKLGVDVGGCRVNVPKQLKWYLKESDKPKVLEYAQSLSFHASRLIEFITLTGLRIEEALRLTYADLEVTCLDVDIWVYSSMSVPGLKTMGSQATLPLGASAGSLIHSGNGNEKVFPISYQELIRVWDAIRIYFNWQDDPTATLKALRRSAARYLHVDCGMPLDMVRQYLRHEKIDTTMEYLRLTGGYNTEEMRRYLK